MKLLYFLLVFISANYVFIGAMQGGEYITIKEVPYQAQLYFQYEYGSVSYCGATIISEYWLLTAAHCIGNKDIKIRVRTGSSSTLANGELIDVAKVIIYGDYDDIRGWESDISLIKTKTPIEFNEYQQPIRIARKPPKVGDVITVTGFGYAYFDVYVKSLKIAHVPVIDNEACQRNIKVVTHKMFCTSKEGIDLCFGDSGSPGVLNNEIAGIASQGCEYGDPNVFTNVAKFYDWIIKHTGIKYTD